MQRDRELVDFEIDPATGDMHVIDASEAGEELLASMGCLAEGRDWVLAKIVNARTISSRRPDLGDILAAFDAKSSVDLVLRGNGLSFADQFWYRAPGSTERWEDVNFFDNGWDTGFGAAVLAGDYSRLASSARFRLRRLLRISV